MILHRLLDQDLHKSRIEGGKKLFSIATPAAENWVPAIVSLTHPKFAVVRKLFEGKYLQAGVFDYDSDRLDEVLKPLLSTAHDLSVSEKWKNIFRDPGAAFDYIRKQSELESQPHMCLIPLSWSGVKAKKFFGADLSTKKLLASDQELLDSSSNHMYIYKEICRIQPANVDFPIFCSKPEFVGMYTQIMGGQSSMFLHNVKRSLAFVSMK